MEQKSSSLISDSVEHTDEQWGSHIFLQSGVWLRPLSHAELGLGRPVSFSHTRVFIYLNDLAKTCTESGRSCRRLVLSSGSTAFLREFFFQDQCPRPQLCCAVWCGVEGEPWLVFDLWVGLGLRVWQKWQNYILMPLDHKIYFWESFSAF